MKNLDRRIYSGDELDLGIPMYDIYAVPCPYCHAPTGDLCKTRSGNRVDPWFPHAIRERSARSAKEAK
jgi:hypothetical protein